MVAAPVFMENWLADARESFQDNTITAPVPGHETRRAAYSRALKRLDVRVLATEQERLAFDLFWKNSVFGGVLPVEIADPRTGAVGSYRITAPQIASQGTGFVLSYSLFER